MVMVQTVKLRDIVEVNTGTKNPSRWPDIPFKYVDVSAVDNVEKKINGVRTLIGSEAPSRARKVICADDILVSTVRPNLNAVAKVSTELDGQIASTGFCVLRAEKQVLPEYLFFFVRSPRFILNLSSLVAGAMYPAVTDKQVMDQFIPLPSVPEQRRIVDILSRAESIVRLRREVQMKTNDLIPVLFLDMFGDPATNPKGWQVLPVKDFVARFEGGKNIQAGGDGLSELRILKVSAVTSGTYIETEAKPAPADYKPPNSYFVKEGDLLFSRANTEQLVGATALVETTNGKTLLPDKLWRFVWAKPVAPQYIHALFQSGAVRKELGKLSTGTSASMRNISQGKLFGLELPIAPIEKQRQFAECIEQIRSIHARQENALQKAETIFASVIARAFDGSAT